MAVSRFPSSSGALACGWEADDVGCFAGSLSRARRPLSFAAEMICYLWFSPSLSLSSHSLRSTPSSPLLHSHTRIGLTPVVPLPGGGLGASSSAAHSPPLAQAPPSTTTAHLPLHLAPSPRFTKFVRATLQMTAVAPHVVLLGLLLLDRYRASTREPSPAAGSEYRLFVTSLLIANKVRLCLLAMGPSHMSLPIRLLEFFACRLSPGAHPRGPRA